GCQRIPQIRKPDPDPKFELDPGHTFEAEIFHSGRAVVIRNGEISGAISGRFRGTKRVNPPGHPRIVESGEWREFPSCSRNSPRAFDFFSVCDRSATTASRHPSPFCSATTASRHSSPFCSDFTGFPFGTSSSSFFLRRGKLLLRSNMHQQETKKRAAAAAMARNGDRLGRRGVAHHLLVRFHTVHAAANPMVTPTPSSSTFSNDQIPYRQHPHKGTHWKAVLYSAVSPLAHRLIRTSCPGLVGGVGRKAETPQA
ncbi:hypothetical protein Taro_034696, partial [Colocasia esculenta]|nr:hypothetical protein [Colocasia esculenta]